jgi:hypothetical protein
MDDRLNALKECIFDTQTSSNEVRTDIQAILNTSQDGLRLKRIINYEKSQLCEKEAHLIKYKKQLKQKRARLADMKRQLGERIENLKESNERSVVGSDDLEENQSILEKNIKMRQQIFNTLNKRKKELIADLFSIYPIEQVKNSILWCVK